MTTKNNIIIEQIKTLTLIEVADLIKELEQAFNIDATKFALKQNASQAEAPTSVASIDAVEEKTTFSITLTEIPSDKKIAILKIIRTITGLGLKESKEIVDNLPKLIKEGVSKSECEAIKKEIETLNGKVLIK